MTIQELQQRAIEVRDKYTELEESKYGRSWTREELMIGFVGDMGDLAKLTLAKEGVRDIENIDEKLAHELSDCLWSILVLAKKYDVDIEKEFLTTMNQLDERIKKENNNG